MALQSELIERTMHLAREDRAELARQLILSLETTEPDAGVDEAWEREIARRSEQVDRGEAPLVDWREAIKLSRASLRKNRE